MWRGDDVFYLPYITHEINNFRRMFLREINNLLQELFYINK